MRLNSRDSKLRKESELEVETKSIFLKRIENKIEMFFFLKKGQKMACCSLGESGGDI